MAVSTILARLASDRGRGFSSDRICVGFARLLAIPFMFDPESVEDTVPGMHFSMAFFNAFR
jgi:hypothetical protein